MYASIVVFARGVCDHQGNKERSYPDGRSNEKCFDVAISESLDNGGEEVLERLRKQTDVLEKGE